MNPYFLRLVASCTRANMECPELFVIGRFLGISATLLLITFFVLVACKIDGEIGGTAWGVVFIPIWVLQTLHLIVGIRYLNPNYDTMPSDQLPEGYRTIRSGRRFGLVLLWMLLLAFNIMIVVQLTKADEFEMIKHLRLLDHLNSPQLSEPRSDQSLATATEPHFESRPLIECGIEYTTSGVLHIPMHVLFTPIYAFLGLVLFALIIPPDFYGYFYLDAFLPVVLAGYYSPPPRFGLPTQMYAEVRLPTKAPEEEAGPEEGGFPDKYPTQHAGSVRDSDEEESGRVRISIQSDHEYIPADQIVEQEMRAHDYGEPQEQETENERELARNPNTSPRAKNEVDIDDAIMK